MNPFLEYYFMIPLAGFLADTALLFLIFSNRSQKRHFWPLAFLYASLALWNLDVMFLFLVKTEVQAKFTFYAAFHVIPIMPLAFLLIALFMSGRIINLAVKIGSLWTALVFLLAEYSFWFTKTDTTFISGIRHYNWGYYPEIGLGSTIFTLQTLYCVVIGFYYFAYPVQSNPLLKKIRNIFIFFWLGLLTSHLPVFGIEIFPIGNATDAVISVFLTQALFESENLRPAARKYLQLAAGLAAIAVALIFSWLITEFFFNFGKALNAVLTVTSSVVAVLFFQRFFRRPPPAEDRQLTQESLFARLQAEYNLTYQEAKLCSLIHEGRSRPMIGQEMRISANTLKVHLSAIYRKTIDQKNLLPSHAKDKLQRLTVFLHAIDRKPLAKGP